MMLSSHSPIDMPARRAASRAVWRASRPTPLTCQGILDFMPASDNGGQKRSPMAPAGPEGKQTVEGEAPVPRRPVFPLGVNRRLTRVMSVQWYLQQAAGVAD